MENLIHLTYNNMDIPYKKIIFNTHKYIHLTQFKIIKN